MKRFIHIRHAKRDRRFPHLVQEGLDQAQQFGKFIRDKKKSGVGAIDFVLTSTKHRSIQTSVAAGFPVNETSKLLAEMPKKVIEELDWDGGFEVWSEAFHKKGPSYEMALQLKDRIEESLSAIPAGKTLMVVTHGGIVEASAVALLPDFNFKQWGSKVGHCEGFIVEWSQGKYSNPHLLKSSTYG